MNKNGKKTYEEAKRIINGSKQFVFENSTTLVITSYYTGETLRLDLGNLTERSFNELQVERTFSDDYYE